MVQKIKDPTLYNGTTQLLPKRQFDDRDGYLPLCIVAHVQVGVNNLFDDFNNRTSNLADCTVVNLRTGRFQRLLKDNTATWTNNVLLAPNTNNPVIKKIKNEKIYAGNVCLTVEHQGYPPGDNRGGPANQGFTEEQIQSDIYLFAYWCQKYSIPADADHIIGHYQFDSQTRAGCPGSTYPFARVIAGVNAVLDMASTYTLPDFRIDGNIIRVINSGNNNSGDRLPVNSTTRNGHLIANGFYEFYSANGGLLVFGEPLSDEMDELQPDGKTTITVQYFERTKLEYHKDNPEGYKVLGERLGALAFATRYPGKV